MNKNTMIIKLAEHFKAAGPLKVFILLAAAVGAVFAIVCTIVECRKKCGRRLFDKSQKEGKKRSGRQDVKTDIGIQDR